MCVSRSRSTLAALGTYTNVGLPVCGRCAHTATKKCDSAGATFAAIHAHLGVGLYRTRLQWTKRDALYVVLQEQRNMRKHCGQLASELVEFEFVRVKRIGSSAAARFRVVELIRRGDDELAGGREHPPHFHQEIAPAVQVLDHLESHHQVEDRAGMRQCRTGSLFELQVRQSVMLAREGHRFGRDVRAHHR